MSLKMNTIRFCTCEHCNYVTDSPGLTKVSTPCPRCGKPGVRTLFPSLSAGQMLNKISYFYQLSQMRAMNRQQQFADNISKVSGVKLSSSKAVELARDIHSIYNNASVEDKLGNSLYPLILNTMKNTMGLESINAAEKIWPEIATYSDTIEEQGVVVILVGSFLEGMLDDLLHEIILQKELTSDEFDKAEKEIDNLKNYTKSAGHFKKLTNEPLKAAILRTTIPKFYSDWERLRSERNKRMHEIRYTPFITSESTFQLAYTLADNSVMVFADLQNEFCKKVF